MLKRKKKGFSMRYYLIIVFVLLTMILGGCDKTPDVITLKSGVQIYDDTLGTGNIAKAGDLVNVHFNIWLIKDSTNLYENWNLDSTRKASKVADTRLSQKPLKFILGRQAFINGSDEAIIGMKIGGTRTIIIPGKVAYAENPGDQVPPNSDLKMQITLVDAHVPPKVTKWDVDTSKIVTTASGIKYVTLSEGSGDPAASGKVVTVNYSGYLKDGTIFDSSVERNEPITFVLGQGQVIKGWEEGLMLMKKGSKVQFMIPPQLAYGSMAMGKIPANSVLIFDIEMLDIQDFN